LGFGEKEGGAMNDGVGEGAASEIGAKLVEKHETQAAGDHGEPSVISEAGAAELHDSVTPKEAKIMELGAKAMLPVIIDEENLLREVSGLSKLGKVPQEHMAILCLKSYGRSNHAVGTLLGRSHTHVANVLHKYDPTGKIRASTSLRMEFVREQLASVAVESLANIRAQDIEELGVKSKIDLARLAVQAIDSIGVKSDSKRASIEEVLRRARLMSQ
jgi:hypothetical protein